MSAVSLQTARERTSILMWVIATKAVHFPIVQTWCQLCLLKRVRNGLV